MRFSDDAELQAAGERGYGTLITVVCLSYVICYVVQATHSQQHCVCVSRRREAHVCVQYGFPHYGSVGKFLLRTYMSLSLW